MGRKGIHKIRLFGVSILASACGSLPAARAQDTGFYVGAEDLTHADIKVARGSLSKAGLIPPETTKDRSETGFKLLAGYQFNPYFGVEGGYAVVGNFSFKAAATPAGTVTITSLEPKAWHLDALATLPLPYSLSLFARAGLLRTRTKVTVSGTGTAAVPRSHFKDTDIGYHAGIGTGFDLNEHLSLRIEWERYRVADGIADKANVDVLSWGLRVSF